jgi:putative protein-disulfide isomerase
VEARNPADSHTLIELANEISLDGALFSADMESPAVQEELLKEIEFTRRREVKGFPTLLLEKEGVFTDIHYDYKDAKTVLHQIRRRC